MTHCITVMISLDMEPQAVFTCHEPDTAWCRQNAVGPCEEPPENPLDCWFTVLASGLVTWGQLGIYIGPPTELRLGEVEFVRAVNDDSDDMCFWHYRGDVGQFPTGPKEVGALVFGVSSLGPTMNHDLIDRSDPCRGRVAEVRR
jgi:hypothetical protein